MSIPAHIEHTFKALVMIERACSPTSAATVCKPLSQDKNEVSPTAGIGTADAGPSYPVTCRAHYYAAATTILEDELRLLTHENADELGLLIEQWIERKRANWEPR